MLRFGVMLAKLTADLRYDRANHRNTNKAIFSQIATIHSVTLQPRAFFDASTPKTV
jgi:hypothetical protein